MTVHNEPNQFQDSRNLNESARNNLINVKIVHNYAGRTKRRMLILQIPKRTVFIKIMEHG